MSQRAKLLQKIRNNPKGVSFDELDSLLQWYGFELNRVRGSHHIYRHRTSERTFTIARHGAAVHSRAIREILSAIDELGADE
jgi:predicted RNA binding protein YcfA (HicA-like mRNA interferase family)